MPKKKKAGAPKGRAQEEDKFIALRVRATRRACGMSQDELGDLIGVSFQQIQKYERAENRVSAGRLFNIAKALGVRVETFYEGLEQEGARAGLVALADVSATDLEALETYMVLPMGVRRAFAGLFNALVEARNG